MQHALKHDERPGGSHKALDGKKNVERPGGSHEGVGRKKKIGPSPLPFGGSAALETCSSTTSRQLSVHGSETALYHCATRSPSRVKARFSMLTLIPKVNQEKNKRHLVCCFALVSHCGDSSIDYVSIQFSSLLSHIVIMTNVATA